MTGLVNGVDEDSIRNEISRPCVHPVHIGNWHAFIGAATSEERQALTVEG